MRLEGEVQWEYERHNAGIVVENLEGVRSVVNLITIKPKISASDIKKEIEAALIRNATIDAENITVDTLGSKITLHGRVRSHTEKEEAEKIAWAAPGISMVDNKIEVSLPMYEYAD